MGTIAKSYSLATAADAAERDERPYIFTFSRVSKLKPFRRNFFSEHLFSLLSFWTSAKLYKISRPRKTNSKFFLGFEASCEALRSFNLGSPPVKLATPRHRYFHASFQSTPDAAMDTNHKVRSFTNIV